MLISIQALVLVPEPYYNESGYEKQIGTQVTHTLTRTHTVEADWHPGYTHSRSGLAPRLDSLSHTHTVDSLHEATRSRLVPRLRQCMSTYPCISADSRLGAGGGQEGKYKSEQYNESTLLLTLKHMLLTVAHPLVPFGPLITVCILCS